MTAKERPAEDGRAGPETREAFRALDRALAKLPPIEPDPQFEARFWARLARAEAATRARGGWREWLPQLQWLAPVVGLALLAMLLGPDGPPLSEPDWSLIEDAEGFELVMQADPDLLAVLDVLEGWDGTESS